jgi:hypothetical protein
VWLRNVLLPVIRSIVNCAVFVGLKKLHKRSTHILCRFAILIKIIFFMKMEAIAKVYEVKFVLDVSQSGENDPLRQNVSN